MKEILKNKIFLILSLFLIFIIVISTNSFANVDKTFTNSSDSSVTFSIPDEYYTSTYHFILEASMESAYPHYYIYYGEYPCFMDDSFEMATCFLLTTGSNDKIGTFGEYYGADRQNPTFEYCSQYYYTLFISSFDVPRYKWLECNYTLVKVSTGEPVFQGAPQVEQPKVELMKATLVEEIPLQITKIVMIILPVFLAIFGTLLVLYLIKSKNLLHL